METTRIIWGEDKRGELQLFSDGDRAGKMDIMERRALLTVYHTEVEAKYEGRGFAKILLQQLVDYARENKLKIVPLCPYVRAQFERYPEKYSEVWHKRSEK